MFKLHHTKRVLDLAWVLWVGTKRTDAGWRGSRVNVCSSLPSCGSDAATATSTSPSSGSGMATGNAWTIWETWSCWKRNKRVEGLTDGVWWWTHTQTSRWTCFKGELLLDLRGRSSGSLLRPRRLTPSSLRLLRSLSFLSSLDLSLDLFSFLSSSFSNSYGETSRHTKARRPRLVSPPLLLLLCQCQTSAVSPVITITALVFINSDTCRRRKHKFFWFFFLHAVFSVAHSCSRLNCVCVLQ